MTSRAEDFIILSIVDMTIALDTLFRWFCLLIVGELSEEGVCAGMIGQVALTFENRKVGQIMSVCGNCIV